MPLQVSRGRNSSRPKLPTVDATKSNSCMIMPTTCKTQPG
jgi:hypothetical protein